MQGFIRIRRWFPGFAVLAALLAGAGLRALATSPPRAVVVVYFQDPEGRYLVPVARSVQAATPAAALAELLAGPAPGSPLAPTLAPGTRVDLAGDGGEWTANPVPDPGRLGREAIARSLLSVPGVGAVAVAGRRWTAADLAPAPGEVLVYYPYRGVPVPVRRTIPARTGLQAMQAALAAFLTQLPPPGLDGPPPGISLVDLSVEGDVARVRLGFSPELARAMAAGAWNFSPYAMSVIYTLTEFPGIRRVQFDFPGLTAAALRQCRTPLSVPLPRPDPERGRA